MGFPSLELISKELQQVESLIRQATRVEEPKIREPLKGLLWGGKRIRPALLILSSKFRSADPKKVTSLAAAVELLHAATLIHDDLIDGARTRRGRRTLNSKLSEGEAVLVGDYLFAWAAGLAAKAADQSLIWRFAETTQEIVLGELQEAIAKPWVMTRKDYYRRISNKTASLFSMASEAGAVISGAPQQEVNALAKYGYNLGMAFQIVDDILDVIGDKKELGKPTGSDLRQGVVTLPILYFTEKNKEWRNLPKLLSDGSLQEKRIEKLLGLVRASPAISLSRSEAEGYTQKAKKALDILPSNPYRQALLDLADSLLLRHN
ncbi:MAG: polyprenyl synthetase family protein [Chloroflexi bacterium]|nr:polyprenyl synthetase family protein [Chloroflexota bacterium]